MRRHHTRSTRTDTLFPYTTLFRSPKNGLVCGDPTPIIRRHGVVPPRYPPPRPSQLLPPMTVSAEAHSPEFLDALRRIAREAGALIMTHYGNDPVVRRKADASPGTATDEAAETRSEEHPSELQSTMRNSYAVLCLHTKQNTTTIQRK